MSPHSLQKLSNPRIWLKSKHLPGNPLVWNILGYIPRTTSFHYILQVLCDKFKFRKFLNHIYVIYVYIHIYITEKKIQHLSSQGQILKIKLHFSFYQILYSFFIYCNIHLFTFMKC